jgi:hypothetical protein
MIFVGYSIHFRFQWYLPGFSMYISSWLLFMSRTCAPLHVHLSPVIAEAIMFIYLSHSSDFAGPGHSFTKYRCVVYIDQDPRSLIMC